MSLFLLRKDVTDRKAKYTFEYNGAEISLDADEAIELVQKTPVAERNCKVSFDTIMWKPSWKATHANLT